MLRRLPIAAMAAVIFAASGSIAVLATTAPALADRDDHPGRHHHVNRPANPYGANGYWSNGAWHYRANPGRHNGWNKHHPKPHPNRDRDRR
jgi:hypothetical protein